MQHKCEHGGGEGSKTENIHSEKKMSELQSFLFIRPELNEGPEFL